MIVVVAPYSPVGRSNIPNLGASRKIEVIIAALAELKLPIVLVNSAHNEEARADFHQDKTAIGGVSVTEVTLPTLKRRAFGKAANLLQVEAAVKRVLALGTPRLVWLYNGYAFECLFARRILGKLKVPVVLEFEDWHFSRGCGPKSLLDYWTWRTCARRFSLAFCVNANLRGRMERLGVSSCLLPGVVPDELIRITSSTPFTRDTLTVGYFGGLTTEKGAHLILQLANRLPADVQLLVSGTGALADEFRRISREPRAAVRFLGAVSVEKLYSAIEECDVIVNPHMSIESMADGIFPFKAIEAVASGRLLISTKLPASGLEEVLGGVMDFDASIDGLVDAIRGANQYFAERNGAVRAGAQAAANRFSSAAIVRGVRPLLNKTPHTP